jgi:molybdopterin converting factor subunit 1
LTVRVALFAALRELAGTDCVPLPAAGLTAAGVRAALAERFPAARDLLARSAVAINRDFADADAPVTPADTVAVLPPVSGG